MSQEKVAILGAGVVGITTGLVLQEAGFINVDVYTSQAPETTTSTKAGAVFEPFCPGEMDPEEINEYVRRGLKQYHDIIEHYDSRKTGIWPHTLYCPSTGIIDPTTISFRDVMPSWRYTETDLPAARYRSSMVYDEIPMIDPTKALPWLIKLFGYEMGQVHRLDQPVTDIDQFVEQINADIVFNCTGLGSRRLVKDVSMQPVRGQILVAGKVPPWTHSVLGDDNFYVFPRQEVTILGGTVENMDTALATLPAEGGNMYQELETTMPESEALILAKAQENWPDLQASDIVRKYAGLRPFREAGVRVAIEFVKGRMLVHNYGHGGSGWTFNWGSADRAVKLALENISRPVDRRTVSIPQGLKV